MSSKLKNTYSLFTNFSSSRKNRVVADTNGGGGDGGHNATGKPSATNGNTKPADSSSGSRSADFDNHTRMRKSGRSSVYFEPNEGGLLEGQNLNDDDDDSDDDDDYDDKLTKEALEGIHLYPPIPTTEPGPVPNSPITLSNMQTLLHDYQHAPHSIEEEKQDEEELENADKIGLAFEHQAERMLLAPSKRHSVTSAGMGISTKLLLEELKTPKIKVREKGFPGELTASELEAVKLLRSELEKRDPVYKGIVWSLSSVEQEAYALCRFLRARKFDVEKVFELLDGVKEMWAKAKKHDFYPDLEASMGVSRAVFLSRYPAVMCGNARNGCPVMYFRAGLIDTEGVNCLVSVDKVEQYFWNDTMHSITEKIKAGRKLNPNFVRFETMTIYDLKGFSRSQFNSDSIDMIKVADGVMASFPETLHCLLIINAPSWFGFVWAIVKRLIDPRTASKIEVFTNAKAGLDRMNELIDDSQIPSDYGGSGLALSDAASGVSSGRRTEVVDISHLIRLSRKYPQKDYTFELEAEKQVILTVYTRCKDGCTASVSRAGDSKKLFELDVVGTKEKEHYRRKIGVLEGPGSFTVNLKSISSTHGHYLLVGTSYSGLSDTSEFRSEMAPN